jgi:hypothetical protein
MAFDPRLLRQSIFAVSLLAAFLFSALSGRSPLDVIVRSLLGIGIAGLAAGEWRSKGHAWVPTLSWTVPLGLVLVAPWILQSPPLLIVIIYWVAGAVMVTMLVSTRAAMWWYRVVLRRPYGT